MNRKNGWEYKKHRRKGNLVRGWISAETKKNEEARKSQ
jgi:hypothetical protein